VKEKDCEMMLNKARNYESQATETVAGQEYIEKAADNLKEAGDCYFKVNNYEMSLKCYSEALEHHKKLKYTVSVAMDSEGIARCYQNLGNMERSKKFMEQAAGIYADQGEKMTMASNLVSAALLYGDAAIAYAALANLDNFKKYFELAAQNYLGYAEVLFEENDYGYAAANLGWASICYFAISNPDEAVKNANKALDICENNNITDDNYQLATLSKAICDGDLQRAKQSFNEIKDNLSETEVKIINQCLQNLE
jgi:tetratricopeptide (TPR) repeat protein